MTNSNSSNSPYILEMRNVSKTFPGVKALDQINLRVKRGSVHALMGENGAGKSTLMKILYGIYIPDEGGELILDDKPFKPGRPIDAIRRGLTMVPQEISPAANLTIADNFYLGREITKGKFFLNQKAMNEQASAILKELGVPMDVTEKMSDVSVAKAQLVAIATAVSNDAKVIIMDEPTAALTQSETVALFKVIESLRKKGVSMVYISHRMEEIFELCDRITVLRDGSYIGVKNIPETNMNEIVKMMIGREIGERYPSRNVKIGKEVLKVKELTRKGTFHDVNFSVRAGEVLGVSGLMGAGRTEIMQAIFGNLSYESGTIEIDGKEVKISNPRQAMEHGIGFITEDRKTEGLMLDKSIRENISLCNLRRISKSSVISREAEKNMVAEAIKDLHIKCFGSYHECNNLSGGNQQKVVLAKWILTNPKILILDEPTRGVDIGAKKEIYSIINKLAAQGVAIIMVSSELPEVLGMSDNIMVVREGEVRGIISYEEANQERVMTLATGGTI